MRIFKWICWGFSLLYAGLFYHWTIKWIIHTNQMMKGFGGDGLNIKYILLCFIAPAYHDLPKPLFYFCMALGLFFIGYFINIYINHNEHLVYRNGVWVGKK